MSQLLGEVSYTVPCLNIVAELHKVVLGSNPNSVTGASLNQRISDIEALARMTATSGGALRATLERRGWREEHHRK